MAVWAVYGRPAGGGRRYLKSVSVVSAERARALAAGDGELPAGGGDAAGGEGPGADLVVRRYGALQAVAWWLDGAPERV